MLFWRKTNKTIWKPPFLREPPPPPFTLTPPISGQFFHDPLFVQILNARIPRLILEGLNYVMALVIISDWNQKLLDEVLVKILINFPNFFLIVEDIRENWFVWRTTFFWTSVQFWIERTERTNQNHWTLLECDYVILQN